MKELCAATILSLLLAAQARADSDGYFCVGKSYIAYQFGLAPPSAAPHRLTIVRFGNSGLERPRVVDLPRFQVHGMDCGENAIRIASFDSLYTVALGSTLRVTGRAAIPAAERGHFPTKVFVQRNLSRLNATTAAMKTDRVLLGSTQNGRAFELVMAPTRTKNPCTVLLQSDIVELGLSQQPIVRLQAFRGEAHRECGQ